MKRLVLSQQKVRMVTKVMSTEVFEFEATCLSTISIMFSFGLAL